jgi:hypothetical protein
MIFMSVPLHTPQLSIFTSAWHGPQDGMGNSWKWSFPPLSTIRLFIRMSPDLPGFAGNMDYSCRAIFVNEI